MKFNKVSDAIKDIKSGKLVIVVDDEDRENEGDLIFASEKVTPALVNFMAKFGRGLICVPITIDRARELKLGPMCNYNQDQRKTAYTISVDAKNGVTTGISAFDRAKTVKVLVSKKYKAKDLIRPGHIFPLVGVSGGVLRRAGHTEAAIDLATLAELEPSGVICEIMKDDGTMARLPDLVKFAKKHHLKIISIKDLISYRHKKEKLIKRVATFKLPTKYGNFTGVLYMSKDEQEHHLAIVKGKIKGVKNVLVRVHSECLTGDALGSLRCDCGQQLDKALFMINEAKRGVVLYMRQEGRGIGLPNKLKAYHLQDKGLDTVEANIKLGFKPDLRNYGIGAQILEDLGLTTIHLMTNNPKKVIGLEAFNLKITKVIPIIIKPNKENIHYLKVKEEKLGHRLQLKKKKTQKSKGKRKS
ncbi:bifunctional 3,4-dihydroxy-2-butanone-4-phosphate synthase/GTP cyclohydrolase II [Candidatus Dependentiae bacterium]|nr:bifunctional 3,4-dihydroxy-2-butanone-4-phosphate synthase/GTP cyclohydrolase II [Candidatus Dependentiae bacterium]